MLDYFVVSEGVDVVVEGGGYADFYPIVALVEESFGEIIFTSAEPFDTEVGAIDDDLADIVLGAEVEMGEMCLMGIELHMSRIGDGAGKITE